QIRWCDYLNFKAKAGNWQGRPYGLVGDGD
ncbi:unnamed protein product, partial [marine sediment metagenome]